jgi:hypothetical protein
MSNISIDFASPQWWIGVVGVGFGIHLAAAYLKPGLDRAFKKGTGVQTPGLRDPAGRDVMEGAGWGCHEIARA